MKVCIYSQMRGFYLSPLGYQIQNVGSLPWFRVEILRYTYECFEWENKTTVVKYIVFLSYVGQLPDKPLHASKKDMEKFHKLGKPMKPKKPLHSEKTSFGGKV